MKKIFAFITSIMLILSAIICFAETVQFEYRNGIHFGDSIQTVKQKETIKASPDHEYSDSLSYYNISLSGISDVSLSYDFEDDKLNDIGISYKYLQKGEKGSIEAEYQKINDGLKRKYGEPLEINDLHEVYGSAIRSTLFEMGVYNTGRVYNLDQWVIPYDDCSVKIDHIFWGENANGDMKYFHLLSYHSFSQENLDIKHKIEEKTQEYLDELTDNDL